MKHTALPVWYSLCARGEGGRPRPRPSLRLAPTYLFSSSSSSFLFIMATIAWRSSSEGRKQRRMNRRSHLGHRPLTDLRSALFRMTCLHKFPFPFKNNSCTACVIWWTQLITLLSHTKQKDRAGRAKTWRCFLGKCTQLLWKEQVCDF